MRKKLSSEIIMRLNETDIIEPILALVGDACTGNCGRKDFLQKTSLSTKQQQQQQQSTIKVRTSRLRIRSCASRSLVCDKLVLEPQVESPR
eukprot:5031419-Amphidinium_carterae.1